jgi:aspartyl-tRNA(Asn)/glutamyl-tRNA(Gln) amidotransferase subunit B
LAPSKSRLSLAAARLAGTTPNLFAAPRGGEPRAGHAALALEPRRATHYQADDHVRRKAPAPEAPMNEMSRQPDRSKLMPGATGEWEVVVGMEVHAQVISSAKLFSGASASYGAAPNQHVSLVDAAMPGMLPVINRFCVEQAIRTGLGLKARINRRSVFDRKNYFYPDLPQGYQISQYQQPIVGEGLVVVDMPDGDTVEVGIERLHLEQDAGKSLHDQHPTMSLVDLNRSGVALMEIVSKPDLRSADEAKAFVAKLRAILRYLGTCDGNMEEGSLRADVNVSVRRPGDPLSTRCEIKNVNSIRFIGQAIEAEARRQIDVIEDGGVVVQETRLFDPRKAETRSMRTKEEAHDYRYFPDPDLLPLELDAAWIEEIKASLPELPDEKKARFVADFGLSPYDAGVLVAERAAADYFETVAAGRDGKAAANWVVNELFGRLNREGRGIEESPVTADQLGAILDLIAEGTISGKIAKELFDVVWTEGGDPRQLVEQRGLAQVTDVAAIEAAVDAVIVANPDKVEQVKAKPAMLGWFVGQVMKASQGKANPQAVNDILRRKLGI